MQTTAVRSSPGSDLLLDPWIFSAHLGSPPNLARHIAFRSVIKCKTEVPGLSGRGPPSFRSMQSYPAAIRNDSDDLKVITDATRETATGGARFAHGASMRKQYWTPSFHPLLSAVLVGAHFIAAGCIAGPAGEDGLKAQDDLKAHDDDAACEVSACPRDYEPCGQFSCCPEEGGDGCDDELVREGECCVAPTPACVSACPRDYEPCGQFSCCPEEGGDGCDDELVREGECCVAPAPACVSACPRDYEPCGQFSCCPEEGGDGCDNELVREGDCCVAPS